MTGPLSSSPTLLGQLTAGALAINSRDSAHPLPQAFSYFADLPDSAGSPGALSSGQEVLTATTGGSWRVSGGYLTLSSTPPAGVSDCYFGTPNLGSIVTQVGGRFTFTTTGPNGVAALGICNRPINFKSMPSMAMRFFCTPTTWAFAVSAGVDNGNTGQVVLASGSLALPGGMIPGTQYEMQAWIVGSTATLRLPDGSITTVADARIAKYAGNFAFCENSTASSSDAVAKWSHFLAATGRAVPGNAGIAPNAGPLAAVTFPRQTLPAATAYLGSMPLKPSLLAGGSRFRITLDFANPATASTTTVNVRFGANGGSADPVVQSAIFIGTGAADVAKVVFEVQIDAKDAAAGAITSLATLTRALGTGTTGFHNVAGTPVAVNQATALNTAGAQAYLGVDITGTAAATVLLNGLIEQVK
ncbi:hypothetical protein ACIP5Y_15585 [Nocardia sp. NPDC088792]|uniref:hypothetical protein n=1 Tax=Nocardia sp. NPDC088792 TaxID=3364332 RepID=UPI0038217D38